MDIFINKSQWSNFTPVQMLDFEQSIFNYYKTKGFPYFDLSPEERQKIFNKLINFNSSSLSKENNILSQNMLGLNLANYYMPHIWETRSGKFLTPIEVFTDDDKFRAAIKKRIKLGDNISDAGIRKILSMFSGAHKVSNFRPTIAKYIYDNYSGAGNVLDFSAGFGGRLLGALSSNKVKNYWGYEPSSKTHYNLWEIIKEFNKDDEYKYHFFIDYCPFEDSNLTNGVYDLAFSSPPYFNLEKYSDEDTQSYLRYPTKDLWKDKFLKILIEKCYLYLKQGGYFIINIANVKSYPNLEQDTLDLAQKAGFILKKTYKMQLSNLMKKDFKYEPIFVFKKV